MAEILIILWFSLVCVLIAGFILGYQLGKTITIKRYHIAIEETIREMMED